MSIAIAADPVPLRQDERGVLRVGSTRVTLDTVIGAFKDGASAEEIVQQYDVLELGDVYKVIGYYLHHRADVEEYLRAQETVAEQLQTRLESHSEIVGIRERLLVRQQQRISELLAPFRQEVESSGISDSELDSWFDEALGDIRRNKQAE